MAQKLRPKLRTLGDCVRGRREELGLSLQAAAEACGEEIAWFRRIEDGARTFVALHELEALSKGLQLDYSVIHDAAKESG